MERTQFSFFDDMLIDDVSKKSIWVVLCLIVGPGFSSADAMEVFMELVLDCMNTVIMSVLLIGG